MSIKSGIQKQTTSILRGGMRVKFDQIRQRHFWSCYFFAPDANGYIPANRFTVFTTPVGSNGQGFPSGQVITERESNWKSQNRVPDNQNIIINELGVGIMSAGFAIAGPPIQKPLQPPAPGAMSNFFQSAVLNITHLTNSVPLGILADYPQSSGMFFGAQAGDDTANNFNSVMSNGFAAPAFRRKLKVPIQLPAGAPFSFTIELPRATYVGYGDATSIAFLIRIEFFATESFSEKS